MISYINIIKALIPFLVMILVSVGYKYTEIMYFKYFPVFLNFLAFLILFVSLFQKRTILQKYIAKTVLIDNQEEMDYYKNLTYAWAIFMFINFIISLATVSMSTKIWSIYNTVVYFFVLALFMLIEKSIRHFLLNNTVEEEE